jgi:hypothetical protein
MQWFAALARVTLCANAFLLIHTIGSPRLAFSLAGAYLVPVDDNLLDCGLSRSNRSSARFAAGM